MRYIAILTTGEYQVPGVSDWWPEELGTESPTLIPLAPLPAELAPVAGWVNSVPESLTLNEIGSQVLNALRAAEDEPVTAYGPVVITGWDPDTEEAIGLHSSQAGAVQQIYEVVTGNA